MQMSELIKKGIIAVETEPINSDEVVEQLSFVEISDQEEEVFEEAKCSNQQTPKESSAMSIQSNRGERNFFFPEKRPISSSNQTSNRKKLQKTDQNNNEVDD
jgi:hypothetical protein